MSEKLTHKIVECSIIFGVLMKQHSIVNVLYINMWDSVSVIKIRLGLSVVNQAIYYAKHFYLIVLCWNRTFIIYNIGKYFKLIKQFSGTSVLNLIILNFNLFKLDIKLNQWYMSLWAYTYGLLYLLINL